MMSHTDKPAEGCCGPGPKLIFACSGAADVGKISDLAARKLAAEGAGKMFCLAGIGGRVSGIMETTRVATAILAIDGCPLDCARKTLEQAELYEVRAPPAERSGHGEGQNARHRGSRGQGRSPGQASLGGIASSN